MIDAEKIIKEAGGWGDDFYEYPRRLLKAFSAAINAELEKLHAVGCRTLDDMSDIRNEIDKLEERHNHLCSSYDGLEKNILGTSTPAKPANEMPGLLKDDLVMFTDGGQWIANGKSRPCYDITEIWREQGVKDENSRLYKKIWSKP